MCAFDLETTSPDPEEARIVTACVALVGGGEPTRATQWLVAPQVPIPSEATAIHGVTTEHAAEHGEPPHVAVPRIAAALTDAWSHGIPVVAFNASYDLTVLERELGRLGEPPLFGIGPVIDPYVMDREVDRYRKGSRTLTAAAAHYRVTLDAAHDATHDAVAAARVAWRIAVLHPQIAAMDLAVLHDRQAAWHATRQADFADYLRRQGKPADDVCGEWPIRTRVTVDTDTESRAMTR
jgi:DNA polymerase-3 subunit epsilon